jgi:hypothetical protein
MIVPQLDKYDFPRLPADSEQRQRERFAMKRAQQYLDERGITSISVGHYLHTSTCVERDGDFIFVYGSERDKNGLLGIFTSIRLALDFVAAIQLKMPAFPLDWPSIHAEFDELTK